MSVKKQNNRLLSIHEIHFNGSLFGSKRIDGPLVRHVLAQVSPTGSLRLDSDLQEKLEKEYGSVYAKYTDKRLRVTHVMYAPVAQKAPLFKDIRYVPVEQYFALDRPQLLEEISRGSYTKKK